MSGKHFRRILSVVDCFPGPQSSIWRSLSSFLETQKFFYHYVAAKKDPGDWYEYGVTCTVGFHVVNYWIISV